MRHIFSDANGLSSDAESSIRMLRERVHTALFQLLMENSEPITAASRLAQILLLIPQLSVSRIYLDSVLNVLYS